MAASHQDTTSSTLVQLILTPQLPSATRTGPSPRESGVEEHPFALKPEEGVQEETRRNQGGPIPAGNPAAEENPNATPSETSQTNRGKPNDILSLDEVKPAQVDPKHSLGSPGISTSRRLSTAKAQNDLPPPSSHGKLFAPASDNKKVSNDSSAEKTAWRKCLSFCS